MTAAPTVETAELRLRPDRTQRLEALLLGAGPHLEAVLDVGGAPNGDLVVQLPVPAARLAALLEAPGGLTAGEAVTVLVPLAQALHRLHRAGVAHGGVRAGAVVLDADGSPAWTAPLAPALLRAAGPTAFAARVAEDEAAFRGLCGALLGPAAVPDAPDLEQLAVRLFGVARPEPVRLVREPAAPLTGPPARLLPAAPADPEPTGAPGRAAALRDALRTVRPRMWAALGGVAVLLVAAVALLPAGEGAPAATIAPRPSASSPSERSASVPAEVAPASASAADALRLLLAERGRCLDRGSGSCLRRVDAVGSPVLATDLAAVRAGVEAVRIDPARLSVTASGGTALGTGGRATVLAIRDRNGWRLRDVVAEPPEGR